MAIRRLTADDWEQYRDIRLDALRTDPDAFASTFERESAFDEDMWRGRISTGPDGRAMAAFIDADETGETSLGTAAVLFTEHHSAPMLVAMWVRPEARGAGSARRLVDAACEWAITQEQKQIVLWVVRDNASAIALYSKCGFAPTGATDTLPSNPCAEELEMIRDLDGSSIVEKRR